MTVFFMSIQIVQSSPFIAPCSIPTVEIKIVEIFSMGCLFSLNTRGVHSVKLKECSGMYPIQHQHCWSTVCRRLGNIGDLKEIHRNHLEL
jgi:hypothetical protein